MSQSHTDFNAQLAQQMAAFENLNAQEMEMYLTHVKEFTEAASGLFEPVTSFCDSEVGEKVQRAVTWYLFCQYPDIFDKDEEEIKDLKAAMGVMH